LAHLGLSGLEGPPLQVIFSTAWASFEPAPRGFTAEASIAAGGAPRTDRIVHPAGEEMVWHPGTLDPCRLEGGSDLPGTRLTVALRFGEGGPGEVSLHPPDPALGPDQTRPAISTFDTSRPDGTPVQEGDVIGFDVIARDQNRPGATWQTGVRRLEVLANGQPVPGAVVEGPPQAPSCDDSARVLNLQGEYRVPRNPDPVIRLCARAHDFAGNFREECSEYFTGEVWEGTLDITATSIGPPGPCGNPWHLDGRVRLEVAADGSVRGRSHVTGPCVSSPDAEFTGTSTEEAFHFGPWIVVMTNGEPIPKVSPTRARATLTNVQGGTTTWRTTWDLTCISCGG
ncbi:MAG TPA: hypothetical protein VMQ81_02080, partial [Acidimicrobiia bacterium]|nr:hypothetical protein [Acidimicrobiia bacterium]